MPSSMIHLQTARYYRPDGDTLYYIGNLAPDCIDPREIKDRLHLRTCSDRDSALRELAKTLDLSDGFQLGVLLHLFLDYRWDDFNPQKLVLQKELGKDWFLPYRAEIFEASAYIFQHNSWADKLWECMEQTDICEYDKLEDYPSALIREFIMRNGQRHREHKIVGSRFFSPQYVDDFCIKSAALFTDWIKNL